MLSTSILSPTTENIALAAEKLKTGGLVAMPTETVYGLAGNALSDDAVAKIFAAKGRPSFNPLIVHVTGVEMASRYATLDARARKLANAFWPGPLTLVAKRVEGCPLSLLVSAGLDTVALRAPAHPVAQALLQACDQPLAAPSANPSGRISPTCAEHVAEGLGGKIEIVLDGGECAVGIESTVLDVSGDTPVILRPGAVLREQIEHALGEAVQIARKGAAITSPGMLESHYAPRIPMRINVTKPKKGEALLAFGAHVPSGVSRVINLSEKGDVVEAAAKLFATMRELDRPEFSGIAAMPIPEEGLGIAINDRLRRAAAGK